MIFEVEQKFEVLEVDVLEQTLLAMGAVIEDPVVQFDRYFTHPSRDFSNTDEAFRIRSVGDENFITYKGPKVSKTTKTRREIELPIAPGSKQAARFIELIEALGFRIVRTVRKQRRPTTILWQGQSVEVALDRVDTLGTFVELELAVDSVNIENAQETIVALARKLLLSNPERRSYLEMVMEKENTSLEGPLSK